MMEYDGKRWDRCNRAERICGKTVDCVGEEGLAEWETKDSKVAVKYCGVARVEETPSLTGEFIG